MGVCVWRGRAAVRSLICVLTRHNAADGSVVGVPHGSLLHTQSATSSRFLSGLSVDVAYTYPGICLVYGDCPLGMVLGLGEGDAAPEVDALDVQHRVVVSAAVLVAAEGGHVSGPLLPRLGQQANVQSGRHQILVEVLTPR